MLSSFNIGKLLTFILVCLLGFTCNLSARSDDSQVQFDSAFGLLGQKWSDINDLYTRDGKLYILSSDGVYAKEDTEWKERKFDPDITVRFGRATQLVVDRNGTVYVVFRQVGIDSSVLTLVQFSKRLKVRKTYSMGYGGCAELDRFSNESLSATVISNGQTVILTISDTKIDIESVPSKDFNNRYLRGIKLGFRHRYVLYGDDITYSFYELQKGTFRPIADVVIDPDAYDATVGDWIIDRDVIKYIGNNSIHTVANGVDSSVPIPPAYPEWEQITKLSSNELALSHTWGHVSIVDHNGVVKEEFGGFGQHVLDIQEGYGGLLVDEETVWLPGLLGVKILGDDPKTIQVLDSNGGVCWTQCITRYDEKSVAVGYSSISGYEYGVAIIDICTQKIVNRLLVKSDYGIYQQVAVCSDGVGMKVVALDGFGNLVSDDWKLDQVFYSVVAHGNEIYARIAGTEGITKISRDGILVAANVFPWLRNNHFAVLTNGKTTDGINVYDANGSILATIGKDVLSISTFSDDMFLLQVNSNTTSVVYRY
jgi:hypothetical protein